MRQGDGLSRPDGRIFAAVWTQKTQPEPYAADWLAGASVRTVSGKSVPVRNNAVELGSEPLFALLPAGAKFDAFPASDVLVSAMDQRSFMEPAHRFTAKPGEELTIPISLFNASAAPVTASPTIRRGLAGWSFTVPGTLTVAPGATATASFKTTVPNDALPGTEYHFRFDAELADGRRTSSYPVRVKVPGEFPYAAFRDAVRKADYPMWDPMLESGVGTGREVTEAAQGTVKVDGKLDDWTPAEFVELDQKLTHILRDPGIPPREEFQVKVAFRWDRDNLHAAFLVNDADLSLLDSVSRDWRDNDNLRIFLSAEPEEFKRGDRISEKELLLIMSPSDLDHTGKPVACAAPLGGYTRPGMEAHLQLAAQLWQGGYVLEVAIPWKELGIAPEPGMRLGLNVLADNAAAGFRRITAMTTLRNTDYWMSPKSLGTLVLK